MTLWNTPERYGSISIGLHWLTLLILIGVYACINLIDLYPKGSEPREALKTWHFMLGLTVLLLVALRLLTRLTGASQVVSPPLTLWQQRLATAIHIALYALMVAMPILAWLLLSAAGKPVPFFGAHLPALLSENKNLAEKLKEIHETIGTIGYFLIGTHALAALFHHYVTRDNTLVRMLPGKAQVVRQEKANSMKMPTNGLLIGGLLLMNATPWAAEVTAPVNLVGHPVPQIDSLPEGPYRALVVLGHELSTRTFAVIGPEVKNPRKRYAGNNLACTSCHQEGGAKPFAIL